jgi:hypothetical protein
MNKEEFIKKYESVKNDITELYQYNCLVESGFDKDKAYEMIDLLVDVWLKDEGGLGLSTISDYLHDLYEEGYNFDEKTKWDILDEIYIRQW